MTKHTRNSLITVGSLLLFALILGACASAETEVPPTATSPPSPPPTPLPDQSRYHAAVAANVHNIYSEEHGPNTYCARCHSPQNWDPEAFFGPPPACFTCKFATDEEIRIAEGNPLIPEDEWVGIPCETCHILDANGIASEQIAWLNPLSQEYEEVNSPNELCRMCHVSTVGGSFGRVAGTRGIDLGGSAHIKYAGTLGDTPPQYCSDCHDPHSQDMMTCEDCHSDVRASDTHMKGYNAIMLDKVSCMACHDASGADVGPHPEDEDGLWTTIETITGRGPPRTEVIVSHSIQWKVDCDRCHSKENAYGLSTRDSAGDPLEVAICADGETLTVLYDDLDTYGVVDVDYTEGECPTEDE